MKKILFILISVLLLTSCTGGPEIIKMATGSTGGTYYPLGSAIAELLTDANSDFVVNAYTGNASVSNIEQLSDENIDMALVQSNVAYWAYNGIGMFEERRITDIRGITTLYPEMIQIIVRSDANINSVADLRGKNVSLGEVGSGNYFDALNILDAYEIDIKDIRMSNYSFKDAIPVIKEGIIDAIFITSGIPTSSVIVMSSELEINLIEIDSVVLDKLILSQPYYSRGLVPEGTYKNVEDTQTLTTRAMWLCDVDLDDQVVYEMTKIFWENYEALYDVHAIALSITIEETLVGMSIDLHPGAAKYYEEIGIEMDY